MLSAPGVVVELVAWHVHVRAWVFGERRDLSEVDNGEEVDVVVMPFLWYRSNGSTNDAPFEVCVGDL